MPKMPCPISHPPGENKTMYVKYTTKKIPITENERAVSEQCPGVRSPAEQQPRNPQPNTAVQTSCSMQPLSHFPPFPR